MPDSTVDESLRAMTALRRSADHLSKLLELASKGRYLAIAPFLKRDPTVVTSLVEAAGSVARIDAEMIGKTWRGVALTSNEVERMVREAGGVPAGFEGLDTAFAWCFGRKAPQTIS